MQPYQIRNKYRAENRILLQNMTSPFNLLSPKASSLRGPSSASTLGRALQSESVLSGPLSIIRPRSRSRSRPIIEPLSLSTENVKEIGALTHFQRPGIDREHKKLMSAIYLCHWIDLQCPLGSACFQGSTHRS